MGLLDRIAGESLDRDYVEAARRPRPEGGPAPRRPGVTAAVMVAVFGVLVATAAVQTSRNEVAAQGSREDLIAQIQAGQARLDARRDRLETTREEVDDLQSATLEATAQGRNLAARLERLGTLTGELPVTGPGVRVVVDDAPDAAGASQQVLDRDLQKLVNGLWLAGAEAVAINDQRVTNLTAIRFAGSAITVNFRSLLRPYEVRAVGDPDALPARFLETEHGAEWLDVQVAQFGLEFDMSTEETMTLPAADRLALRHATVPEDAA